VADAWAMEELVQSVVIGMVALGAVAMFVLMAIAGHTGR
jgi:hypothetical protein